MKYSNISVNFIALCILLRCGVAPDLAGNQQHFCKAVKLTLKHLTCSFVFCNNKNIILKFNRYAWISLFRVFFELYLNQCYEFISWFPLFSFFLFSFRVCMNNPLSKNVLEITNVSLKTMIRGNKSRYSSPLNITSLFSWFKLYLSTAVYCIIRQFAHRDWGHSFTC